MKKALLPMLMIICIVNIMVTAGAADDVNTNVMAVYINNGFLGNSAIVNGSIYSANNNIEFDSSEDNKVSGNIYLNAESQFIIPENDNIPDFKDRVFKLDNTYFNETFQELIDFPEIENYIAKYDPAWDAAPLVIDRDTHFGELNVGPLTVDVREKDISIVVDKLSFKWSQSITLNGDNKLFLFIKNYANLSSGPIIINNGNNPDKTFIYAKNSISHVNLDLYAHVFYDSIDNLTLTGTITGNVVTNAGALKLEGGGNVVNGLIYAPYANATVSSPNEGIPNITGRIVADRLSLTGRGRIDYSPAELIIPKRLIKLNVTVRANNPNGGTVTPESVKVGYGETVNISATPNEGYNFTGFTSSNGLLPDEDGNLIVTDDVDLVANFEAISSTQFVSGLLGEYYDAAEFINESALRIKRIDQNVAFNFMYDSPDPVIEPDTFAIRWTGYIKPEVSGNYIFKAYSDDGIKLKVDDKLLIDRWGLVNLEYTIADEAVYLEAGTYYPIEAEYQERPLNATVFLLWESENVSMSIVPESVFYVKQDVYDEYKTPVYFNSLERRGTGLTNVFFTLDEDGNRVNEYTETNNIYYFWGLEAPGDIKDDVFYGVMEGYIEAKYTETVTLGFMIDDGVRVFIDDQLVIDAWGPHSEEIVTCEFDTVIGTKYKIRIEYVDLGLGASCTMFWQSPLTDEIVPIEYLYGI